MPDSITITLPSLGPIPLPDIGPMDLEFALWELAVVLLAVLVLVVVFLLLVWRGRNRRCPFCRQRVAGAATLCKHCGSSLLKRRSEKRLAKRRTARRRRV